MIFQAPHTISNELKRIAIGIQYDGSSFSGWQSQVTHRTVQDHIESAITHFIGGFEEKTIRLTAAGRTDSGVHALGQVAHFDTVVERPDWSWVRGLNNFLPSSISIQWAKQVPVEFDARFSAFERSYVYFLLTSPVKISLLHQKAGYHMLPPTQTLKIEEMRKASQYLLGEHDFSCFRSSECQSKTPIKTIYQIDIVEEGPKVFLFLRANAFLHHMVRNIAGVLISVGSGKHVPIHVAEVLEAKDRRLGAETASPYGLYLVGVTYPEHFGIPQESLGPWFLI